MIVTPRVLDHVKTIIYSKIKFLSDNDDDYNCPDFVGDGRNKQTVAICNSMLDHFERTDYSIKQKVLWWVTYRKKIREKISRLRQADVRALQELFIKGKPNITHWFFAIFF